MTRTQKTITAFALFGVIAAALIGFLLDVGPFHREEGASDSGKIKITTAFYPLYEFSRQVGGDHVVVKNTTPAGSEPHEYEPAPKELAAIQDSDVFVYNGASFQPWADKIAGELQSKGVTVIDASKDISLLPGEAEESHAEEEQGHAEESQSSLWPNLIAMAEAHEGEPGEEAVHDPHFWLDPVLAQREVATIQQALSSRDQAHRDDFASNAQEYSEKLRSLDTDFREGLADCRRRDVVASHEAFGYLAKRYRFNAVAISGLSTEEEPTPKKLAEISQFVKSKDIRYIFFETLVSPKLSETIAKETGAQTLVFNPIEGLTEEELAQDQDYISVQKENLANLKTALACK